MYKKRIYAFLLLSTIMISLIGAYVYFPRGKFSIALIYEGNGASYDKNWFFVGEKAIFSFKADYSTSRPLNFYLYPYGGGHGILVYSKRFSIFSFGAQIINFSLSTTELNPELYYIEVVSGNYISNGSLASPKYNYQQYPWFLAIIEHFSPAQHYSSMPPLKVPYGLGINIHFVRPTAEQLQYINMISYAGFKFVRMDFFWNSVETERNQYNFSSYTALAEALNARGLRPLFIIDYGDPLYDGGKAPYNRLGFYNYAMFAANASVAFDNYDPIWE
ncbi:MAG: hypothetical protein ACP5T2_06590, partial [Thermoprotei archaeon]